MKPIGRLGDLGQGVCKIDGPQIGRIITASSDTFINQRGIARLGDIVLANCGHTGRMITGSGSRSTNNLKTTRIGDAFDGIFAGRIITGSPDNFAGD